MDRSRNGRSAETRYGEGVRNPRARQRALCIAVGPDELDLSELHELLRTAGVAVAGELTQRRPRPDPDRYLGKGKLAELKQAVADNDANLIACDDELLPRQERNLEQEVGVPVIDRTAIILDIFADHAASAEGKLQVELAQLEYNLARMRGLWTHLERLGGPGAASARGPGETQIETDRRLARDRIAALKQRLEHTKASRQVMRRSASARSCPPSRWPATPTPASPRLLNALTGADVGVRDRLFHTLDPTTRSFEISGRRYLLTDTVGFIRKLPHQLVDAFAATLEEALEADLILHVADASVREEELVEHARRGRRGAGRDRGRRAAAAAGPQQGRRCSTRIAGASCRSATRTRCRSRRRRGRGSTALSEAIEARFLASLRPMELLVPYQDGGSLSELHDLAGDMEREDTAGGRAHLGSRAGGASRPASSASRWATERRGDRVRLRFARLRRTRCARRPAPTTTTPAYDLYAVGGGRARAGRARERRHRPRRRDSAGPRRAGAAALGAGRDATASRWSTLPA